MAKRAKNVPAVDVDALVRVFCTLASFDSSEIEPVTVQEMADELDGSLSDKAFELLETLADAELIEFERGRVWISREDVTQENAEDIATNALNGFEPVSEERKRLEYAVKTAESQDGDMSQAPEHSGKAPEKVAETPVQVAHAVAEARAVEAATPKPEPLPEIDGLSQFIDDETGDMVYESRIVKSGLALDESKETEIPPLPAGVTPNFWDLAHNALTLSAREYWARKVESEIEEYKTNNGQPAPF